MARYLQVSSDIAERVAAGVLAPGDELASLRQTARRYDTTPATIGRAYRVLADAGLIDVSGRRLSRVAAGGQVAGRRLMGG
jgi:DNA-binding transcriptional regulator YhcF (GntR family)